MATLRSELALLLVLSTPALAPAADPAPVLTPGPFDPLIVTKDPLILGHLSLGKYRESLSPRMFEYVAREFRFWNEGSYYLEHMNEFSFCIRGENIESGHVGVMVFDQDTKIDDVTHNWRTEPQKHGKRILHATPWGQTFCLVSARRLVLGSSAEVKAYLDRLDDKKPIPLPEEWQDLLKSIDQTRWLWAGWMLPTKMSEDLSSWIERGQQEKPIAKLGSVTLEMDLRHLDITLHFRERESARLFYERMLPFIEQARQERRRPGLDLLVVAATRPLETLNLQCRGRSVRFDVDLPGLSDLLLVWLEGRLRTAGR